MTINRDYMVAKRNVLNEIRANNMTLQELRFFSIYLSKINSEDLNTRVVRFSLSDFQKIMELNNKIKISYLQSVTNSLLCKVVNVPKITGGYEAFQLFKKCDVDIRDCYIEIDAHDNALPLMFEFKDKYFTYQLWNALRLKSSNQLRMYEILKQYEKLGERIISVDELKELLGISLKEYSRYGDFKTDVLEVCRKSLEINTDIKFTFEPTGKKGRGGKIIYLKFVIQNNENYVDQLSLDEFICHHSVNDTLDKDNEYNKRLNLFTSACNDEFSFAEIQVLYNLVIQILTQSELSDELKVYHFYKNKYDEMVMFSERTKIHNRFSYLKSLFEGELNQ